MIGSKIFIVCFLAWSFGILGFPEEFQIRQEASRRRFTILEGERFLGAALNSKYGQFDFYDATEAKIATNVEDALLDHLGKELSFLKWEKDPESQKWFWQRRCNFCRSKKHFILESREGAPLLTLDEEGSYDSFVFREYETKKAVAVAFWSWPLLGNSSIAAFDDSVQHWNVIVVDRAMLEEKNILLMFLVWPLLKFSQLYLPAPRDFPYETCLDANSTK